MENNNNANLNNMFDEIKKYLDEIRDSLNKIHQLDLQLATTTEEKNKEEIGQELTELCYEVYEYCEDHGSTMQEIARKCLKFHGIKLSDAKKWLASQQNDAP